VSRLLALLVVMLTVLAPVAARAMGVCAVGVPEPSADADDDTPDPEPPATVVPCGMAESGLLGPGCVDASFYVVSNQGVLLCRMSLWPQVTSSGALPVVHSQHGLPSSGVLAHGLVAVVPHAQPRLAPPLVHDVARARPTSSRPPHDVVLDHPPLPS
jgi:hypothetical protein